ncbi:disulfide bond formation protein DsbA [Streptomyces sp. NPDC051784]|uniref:DsbA family protein n=1 Tax=Streptomyces sp. NPDC051784 TaxID=3155805 RepID=UPI0034124A84
MNMSATMWFDPSCPFTWRTSRWLRAEAAVRDEKVTWRLMSLAVLNEGRDDVPSGYREGQLRAARLLRVLAASAEHGGNEAVDSLYTAHGTRVHERAEGWDDRTLRQALTEAGLSDGLAAAADDESWDEVVRASHAEGQARVGQESGTPVVAFGDAPGFFGPILTAVPAGEEAARLYDSVAALATVTAFSELKRARN